MNVKLSSRVLNQVGNEPSVYQKVTLVGFPYFRRPFFNNNDSNALGMINQAADGGHIGASYALAIIIIFKGGGMWVSEPHVLGERPICCTVHQHEQSLHKNAWPKESDDENDIRCELCSGDLELDYIVKFLLHTTVWY
ncbi:hypothetical protein H5410_057609 [Solanum commersonii]|uniref:Uncharacterized protein n=1 Tax=Solanum commersonii TaxID=4109 RepID=A0A9J5WNC9_SOLCO|nr:hypothetical protein H5410_057609 [Solanum commersonii]